MRWEGCLEGMPTGQHELRYQGKNKDSTDLKRKGLFAWHALACPVGPAGCYYLLYLLQGVNQTVCKHR